MRPPPTSDFSSMAGTETIVSMCDMFDDRDPDRRLLRCLRERKTQIKKQEQRAVKRAWVQEQQAMRCATVLLLDFMGNGAIVTPYE